jgi:hypothetical protein
MRRLLIISLFCLAAFRAMALVPDVTIHGMTKGTALNDSTCIEYEYKIGATWYSRHISVRQLIALLRDTTMTGTYAGGKIGLKIQGTHRWHLAQDISDDLTIAQTAGGVLYVPNGGIGVNQMASSSVGTPALIANAIDSTKMQTNSIPSNRIVDNYPGVYITPTFYWNYNNTKVCWQAGFVIRGTLAGEASNWSAFGADSVAVGSAELLAMNITDGTLAVRAWNSGTNKYTRGNKYRVIAYHYGGSLYIDPELDSKIYDRYTASYNITYQAYNSTYITPIFYWNYNYTKINWISGFIIRNNNDWTAISADSLAIGSAQVMTLDVTNGTLAAKDWLGGAAPFANSTVNKYRVIAYRYYSERYLNPSLNTEIAGQYYQYYNRYESIFITPSFYRTGHTGNTIKWDDVWIVGKDPTVHLWTKIDADPVGLSLSADYTCLVLDLKTCTISVKQWNADTNPYIRDPRYRVIAFHITSTNTVIFPNFENQNWRNDVLVSIGGLTAQWNDKTIVWMGTSIPASANYPATVCSNVGATLVNLAQGSSHVKKISATVPYSGDWTAALSQLSETTAEKQSIITNYATIRPNLTGNPPTTSAMTADSAGIQTTILNWSYQHLVNDYVDAAAESLIVFDHGYNDSPDENVYDLAVLLNTRDSGQPGYADSVAVSRNRKNYFSAMNYILDKIYEKNPYQRIMLVTHYYTYTANRWLIPVQEELAKYWQIPICKVYEKMCFTDQKVIGSQALWSISPWSLYTEGQDTDEDMTQENVYIPDRVHPHTDPTHVADNLIAKILTAFLRDIF